MIACSISDGIWDNTGAVRGVGKYWQPGRGFTKVSLAAADRSLPSFSCCPIVREPQKDLGFRLCLNSCFNFLNKLALAHMQAVAQMLYASVCSACHLL